jgi:glycosyltransferase involved in cell wall biosynthesis
MSTTAEGRDDKRRNAELSTPTIVILDPSLRTFMGHFLTYDRVIAHAAARRGMTCIVWAARNVKKAVLDELEIVPCFRFGLEDELNASILADAFFSDLLSAAGQSCPPPGTTYFLHTTTATQIEPAVRFIARDEHRDDRLVIMLRYSIVINPNNPSLRGVEDYRRALNFIAEHHAVDRVRLVTDSDILADEYATITDLPIDVVPIPHVGGDIRPNGGRKPRTLTYLGNARASKGFQYLPYVVSQIRPQLLRREWTAEFQSNVMFERDTESVYALCKLRKEPVTLWEDDLSLSAYDALLDRASLVVLPYQLLWYHSQSSGVFAEAVGKGKPVVVPSGTWMARQVQEIGAGVRFAPGDRVDLARAVREAMLDIEQLEAKAALMRAAWIVKHNPENFLNCLLADGRTP